MISAGQLRDKITIQSKTITTLDNGDLQNEWSDLVNTFAKVREKSGGYSFETGSLNAKSKIEVVIRYRPNVSIEIGNKIIWRGFDWIIENSPVVDYLRTSITMEATIMTTSALRGELVLNDSLPYTLPFTLLS